MAYEAFHHSGREFVLTEITTTRHEAELAAHEYAHEGLYFRLMERFGEWYVYTAPGRKLGLSCCSPRKSYVYPEGD